MIYGKVFTGGASSNHAAQKAAPSGKILVFDDSRVYGFSRLPHLHRWVRSLEFHLFAADKYNRRAAPPRRKRNAKGAKSPTVSAGNMIVHIGDENPRERQRLIRSLVGTRVKYEWSNHDPAIYANAMVLTSETLFSAGPPAIRNEATADALGRWRGQAGGLIKCLARTDGRLLGTVKLASPPVFDGMAAAYGKLYICLADGSVVCLSKGK
jgi:hypothetical protein